MIENKDISIQYMVFRGIWCGANATAIGAIGFSCFLAVFVGASVARLPGMIVALVLGTVFSTITAITFGVIGGIILSIWIRHDWAYDVTKNKIALPYKGMMVGGIFTIPACILWQIRAYGPLDGSFILYSTSAILFGTLSGLWAAKKLMNDISDLTKVN